MSADDAADRGVDASDVVNRLGGDAVDLADPALKCGDQQVQGNFMARLDGLDRGRARAVRVVYEVESDGSLIRVAVLEGRLPHGATEAHRQRTTGTGSGARA